MLKQRSIRGFCARCRGPLLQGMLATRTRDGTVMHAKCYHNGKLPQRKPPLTVLPPPAFIPPPRPPLLRQVASYFPQYNRTPDTLSNVSSLLSSVADEVTPSPPVSDTAVTPFDLYNGTESVASFQTTTFDVVA